MNTDMNSTNRNRRRPFVKVCGQTYTGSVDCAVAYGASYIGFNFCLGSPRYVSPSHAAGMRSVNVKRVGVFQQQEPAEICRIMRQAGLHLAQLQGGHTPQDAEAIGPHRIIHRLRVDSVRSAAAVQEEIRRWAPYCRAFLVEAENAALLAELEFPRPWILSARMDPAQLGLALELCRPDGVDFDSCGEAAPGIKSPRRLLQAMRTVRA